MTNAISLTKFHINAEMVRALCMVLCFVMVLSFVMVSNIEIAYCDPTDPTDPSGSTDIDPGQAITDIGTYVASAVYKAIRGLVTPFVILAFVFAGLQFLLGGNQGTEKAKKIAICACIGFVIVIFAPYFGGFLGEQFAQFSTDDLSQFNKLN